MGGAGGIPYMAISQYARDHEISGRMFDSLIVLVREMDDEYLTWQSEQKEESATSHDKPVAIPDGHFGA